MDFVHFFSNSAFTIPYYIVINSNLYNPFTLLYITKIMEARLNTVKPGEFVLNADKTCKCANAQLGLIIITTQTEIKEVVENNPYIQIP